MHLNNSSCKLLNLQLVLLFLYIQHLLFTQAHPGCIKNLTDKCNFGHLFSIMLPPYCVSIPRTDVPLETILGFQLKKNTALGARKFKRYIV